MSLVFVYGTLKRGGVRAGSLAGQAFLGEAATEPRYRLVDCGDYPGIVEIGPDGLSVRGEVYDVSPERLAVLDEVEGVDEGLYARRRIELRPPFTESLVEAYFYLPPTEGLPDIGDEWRHRP